MVILLKGGKFSLFIEGELKKLPKKEILSLDNFLDYFFYWYEGFVEIKINSGESIGKFNFKTLSFKDFWTEEILSLRDCFIFFDQKTLFYKRFYEDSGFAGIREGKFNLLVDLVAEELLNQIKEKKFPLCPLQFKLTDLVEKGICYKNKYPMESSEFF